MAIASRYDDFAYILSHAWVSRFNQLSTAAVARSRVVGFVYE